MITSKVEGVHVFLFEDLVLEKRLEHLARCSRFHSVECRIRRGVVLQIPVKPGELEVAR